MHPTIPLTIWASENIRTLSEVFGKDREKDSPASTNFDLKNNVKLKRKNSGKRIDSGNVHEPDKKSRSAI